MTRDHWVGRHPYLRPIADVQAAVEAAAATLALPEALVPDWNAYASDFRAGVPLLHSAEAAVDVSPALEAVRMLVARLAAAPLPATTAARCRALAIELDDANGEPLRDDGSASPAGISPPHQGLYRYLAWSVLGRFLRPVVIAFDGWRDEDHWLRNYCPTCGEPPAMAQLVGKDPGRLRKLSCGRCGTRWRYRRTGCPFCDRQGEHRLAVLAVEGEAGLRIDYCDVCSGYLKSYDGEGHEAVLLADWTSLHLDLIARDRGLKRLAASLYDLPAS